VKIFVMYDKSGIHSGRALGKSITAALWGKATVHKGRPRRLLLLQKQGNRYDYIINVGWYKGIPTQGAVVLNAPQSIADSSNKKQARIKFKGSNIPAPRLWVSAAALSQRDLPVIARTTHHAKGRGLWHCRTLADVRGASRQGATHFLKLIPNTREFRVHVMAPTPQVEGTKEEDFRVIKLSEKLPSPKTQAGVVKNHDNGWIFGYPSDKRDPILRTIREVGKRAIAAFGLHWGAVDVMVSRDTGEPFVLEINSTPCLTDDNSNTLDKYTAALCEMLSLRERPESKKKKPPAKKAVKTPTVRPPSRKLSSFLRRSVL